MPNHYYLGRYYENVVLRIMERNLPHEDCSLSLFPGSGRKSCGDLACAATKYEVKAFTGKRPTVYAGIPIFCFVGEQVVRIEFPFQLDIQLDMECSPLLRGILVSGHFCPVLAQQVHKYPHIIIPQSNKRRYLQPGGTGVWVRNIFVRVETNRCPLCQSLDWNSI